MLLVRHAVPPCLTHACCCHDPQVWDLTTLQRERTLSGHTDAVRALAVAGGRLFSGSYDGTVRVWDESTLTCIEVLKGHVGPVRTLVHCGNYMFSGSYDKTVRVWDVTTLECKAVLSGHTSAVRALVASTSRVFSGSDDATIKVWGWAGCEVWGWQACGRKEGGVSDRSGGRRRQRARDPTCENAKVCSGVRLCGSGQDAEAGAVPAACKVAARHLEGLPAICHSPAIRVMRAGEVRSCPAPACADRSTCSSCHMCCCWQAADIADAQPLHGISPSSPCACSTPSCLLTCWPAWNLPAYLLACLVPACLPARLLGTCLRLPARALGMLLASGVGPRHAQVH